MCATNPVARAVCVMPDRRLKLSLSAGESLPTACSWMIDDGYLLVGSWSQQGELTTLSIWGPGDIVIPALIHAEPLVLSSLSAVKVKEWAPTPQEEPRVLHAQLQQLSTLLTLTRVRSAETRLYQLLLWLGERFGRVNSSGVSLSFQGMNLTHQQLASIAGMTRFTVTKALTSFRKEGTLIKQGDDELLRRSRNPET